MKQPQGWKPLMLVTLALTTVVSAIDARAQTLVAPTAPAGAVVVGGQTWVCDAAQGLTRVVNLQVSAPGIHLPISPTTVPATCGQMAADANGTVYVTQAVVDTTVTPSAARGVLRETFDPQTGEIVGAGAYIATTAGLDGNQPTAAALGPDGNLYVAFLKGGNIKRIVKPAVATTQAVQSVGNTPNGHPARALAFVGGDLYIASVDAFSVIHGAISASCTGGCNAAPIADGFSGAAHVGVTSDGIDAVYFSVASVNQVWRYTPSTGLFAFVAQGFSFVAAKTNLLTLDGTGTLWIGDQASISTIGSAVLGAITGGRLTAGTNLPMILAALRGPWVSLVVDTVFTPTFNTDGTFTATIQGPSGAITTDAGTWTLTPPERLQPVGNPQAHLTLTDAQGIVLLSGDVMLLNADQLFMQSATDAVSVNTFAGELVLSKLTV